MTHRLLNYLFYLNYSVISHHLMLFSVHSASLSNPLSDINGKSISQSFTDPTKSVTVVLPRILKVLSLPVMVQ